MTAYSSPDREAFPSGPRWRTLAAVVGAIVVLSVGARVLAGRSKGVPPPAGRSDSVTTVDVVVVASGDSAAPLDLPGTTEALVEAAIYARTDGYVKTRVADIGQRVRRGQLLAELERPELEGDIAAAGANEEQARAALGLARTTMQRWEQMAKEDAVAPQELDERRAAWQQRQADLAAASAQVARLEAVRRFQKVTAPFDGVITERNVELGDLIVSGNAQAPLFRIAQTRTLRIQVNVPQGTAQGIRPGVTAEIVAPETPAGAVTARVARTANALDPQSRTLLTELQVPNEDGRLLPGTYVRVRFALGGGAGHLTIPANTLLFGADGPTVVTVRDGVLHLRPITIARDLGTRVEVGSGLEGGESLVLNPTVTLVEGQRVQTAVRGNGAGS